MSLSTTGVVRHRTDLSSLIAASASTPIRALSLLARCSSRLRNVPRAPAAVPTRQNVHTGSNQLAPGGQPCEVCFPRTRQSAGTGYVEPVRCGVIAGEEKVRAWITAHSADRCCGHRHRTLVLCFDGTGEMFDEDSSNVVRFCSMLKKDDNSRQLIHYQSGVGTYIDPVGYRHIIPLNLNLALDKAFAWSLSSHVKDGYALLMQNYTEGDKICIFGFSRGAYVARALVGMIQKVGLLPICNDRQIPAAYDLYLRQDDAGIDLCYDFKTKFARSVSIEFLGLWDTVASVGIRPKQLPFIFENTGVRTLRQALALDERRAKFIPQFCYDPPKEDDLDERASMGKAYMDLVDDVGSAPDVQEVWFAGVHTDIGGGAIKDNRLTTPSLARIPLRWMIRECFEANTGIVFDAHMLQAVGLPVLREIQTGPNGEPITMYKLDSPYEWSPVPSSDSSHDSPPLEKHSIIFDGVVTFSRAIRRSTARILKRITREVMLRYWPFSMFMVRPPKRKREREHYEWRQLSPEYEYAEEMKDMRTEIHCQLADKPLWMVLELIPLRVEQQTALVHKMRHGKSYRNLWNRGRGRRIFQTGVTIKVHRTVKMRLENDPTYVPQARPELEVRYLHDRDPDKDIPASRLSRHTWNESNPAAWMWFPSIPKTTRPSST